MVGHSKGNYSIENALEGWLAARKSKEAPLPAHLRVVTLGAVIWFSPGVANLQQFIGTADYFGMINSRPFVRHIDVPGAWHSLNSEWHGHLSVGEALQQIGVE